MKRKLALLVFMLVCVGVRAQNNPTPNNNPANLTTAGTSASYTVTSAAWQQINTTQGACGIGIAGTWTGTISFYLSINGQPLVAASATPSNSATTVTSTTGNGAWQINCGGYSVVYAIFTTASSGTANVTINAAQVAFVGGGGSGAGGTIASCATTNAETIYTAATTLGCGNGDFTYATHTMTMGVAGFLDLHSATGVNAFRLPLQNGGLSNVSGALLINTGSSGANGNPLTWENGTVIEDIPMLGGNGAFQTPCTTQAITVLSGVASPTCGGLSAYITGSDYTNATGSATNVTGLSFSIAASTNYSISCKLIYQGSATTTTMTLTSTGPAAPTKVTGQTLMGTTGGSTSVNFTGAFDGTTFGFTAGPPASIATTAADLYATLDVGIINGTTAGTWQLQATNGTGTLTIKQGSYCRIS